MQAWKCRQSCWIHGCYLWHAVLYGNHWRRHAVHACRPPFICFHQPGTAVSGGCEQIRYALFSCIFVAARIAFQLTRGRCDAISGTCQMPPPAVGVAPFVNHRNSYQCCTAHLPSISFVRHAAAYGVRCCKVLTAVQQLAAWFH